jgi:hypothetical protein
MGFLEFKKKKSYHTARTVNTEPHQAICHSPQTIFSIMTLEESFFNQKSYKNEN